MDSTVVASIRKNLEATPTAELRQAYESGDKANRSAEELEAMRQLLDQRSRRGGQFRMGLSAAVVLGAVGAAAAWSQGNSEGIVFVAGASGAVLGFASCYIPGLFGQA